MGYMHSEREERKCDVTMGFKICIINQEYRTYFHGQENNLTAACFETLR